MGRRHVKNRLEWGKLCWAKARLRLSSRNVCLGSSERWGVAAAIAARLGAATMTICWQGERWQGEHWQGQQVS